MKIVTRIVNVVILIGFIIIGILTIITTSNSKKYALFSVMSGSMVQSLPVGTLVLVAHEDSYNVGDIVTYKPIDSPDSKSSITHRIIKTVQTDNGIRYITKGDANRVADSFKVTSRNIVGKVIFKMPLAGYVTSYIQTIPGAILLVVVPATLLVRDETERLFNSINRTKNTSKRYNFKELS